MLLTRGRQRNALAVVAVLALTGSLFVVAEPSGAAPSPIDRTNSQISTLQARAQALAERITTDQNKVSVAAEAYDMDTVLLQQDKLKLAKVQRQLKATRKWLRAARAKAQNAAIEAYVTGDGFASQVDGVLTSSVNDAQSAAVYSDIVVHSLKAAVNQLHVVQVQLAGERARQARTTASATRTQLAADKARGIAEAATLAVESALTNVKGQLYTLTIKREQEIAAAKAAAALAAERAAAARAAARARAEARAAAARAAKARAQAAAQAAALAAKKTASNSGGTSSGSGNSGGAWGGSWPFGPGTGPGQPGFGSTLVPAGTNPQGLLAVAAAESYLGVPYVWGGAGRQGVDCSGLVMVAWQAAGVSLLHGATIQDQESTPVNLLDIEPGDLLFYHFPNDGPLPITHVAIYIGSGPYGTDTIIQAAQVGTNVAYYPMYWGGFVSAGRP
jgi:cell wall-associated NlpC family hydrolase